MTHKELIQKLKPGTKLHVKGEKYTIVQHIVWHQSLAGYPYDKYVLEDETGYQDYRLFVSSNDSAMGMAKIFHFDFIEPLDKEIEWKDKKYRQTNGEFCTIIDLEGKGPYKAGESEFWWDYECSSKNLPIGLSLGRSWETWEREDLETQSLELSDIELLN